MKSERRHELKENDLIRTLMVARDYLDEHRGRVGIVVVAIVAVFAVTAISVRSRAATSETAWQRKNTLDFNSAETGKASLKTLRDMTREIGDRSFILNSLIDQGAVALRLTQQVDDPPDRELNEQAKTAYQRLLADFPDNALAVGTAHAGLATVAENTFALDENTAHRETARQHLAAIIKDPRLSTLPFHRMARDRLEHLDETFTIVRFAPPRAFQTDGPIEPSSLEPIPSKADGTPPPPPSAEEANPDQADTP